MTTGAGATQTRAALEGLAANVTVPAKPFTEVTVITELPEPPIPIAEGVTGPRDTVKSVTDIVNWPELEAWIASLGV
jgi:hypothetical protein